MNGMCLYVVSRFVDKEKLWSMKLFRNFYGEYTDIVHLPNIVH